MPHQVQMELPEDSRQSVARSKVSVRRARTMGWIARAPRTQRLKTMARRTKGKVSV